MLRGITKFAPKRFNITITCSKRYVGTQFFGQGWQSHTRYAQVSTAKMDENWPTWLEEFEFDDLPYTHRDLFNPHETSIRQMRMIEAEVVSNLLREDRVPEALIPICKEIFYDPKTEKDRLHSLWWDIEDMYTRVHPSFTAEKPKESPLGYEDMMALSAGMRNYFREQGLVGKVLFEYEDSLVAPVAKKFPAAEMEQADWVALALANAVQAGGGPAIPFRFGRTVPTAPDLPNLHQESAGSLQARLSDYTPSEIVALGSLRCLELVPKARFSRNYLKDGLAVKQGAFADAEFAAAAEKYVRDFELLQRDLRDAFIKLQEHGLTDLIPSPMPPRPQEFDGGADIGFPENRCYFGYPESLNEKRWRTGEMK